MDFIGKLKFGPNYGQIESHAIFQLLMDKNGNPCLFLQRIYPAITDEKNRLAIIALAEQKAKSKVFHTQKSYPL